MVNKRWCKITYGATFFILILMLTGFPGQAVAHKVTVFAWVEGDTVFTESKFSRGKRVNGGEISVYDKSGNRLVEGKTNHLGEFSFTLPGKPPLIVELNAGMGHRAQWTIQADDMGESPIKNIGPAEVSVTVNKFAGDQSASSVAPIIQTGELEANIEKILDKKLKPIIKMLVELQQSDPSLTDVLGGMGYIIGLVGIVTYYRNRKPKN